MQRFFFFLLGFILFTSPAHAADLLLTMADVGSAESLLFITGSEAMLVDTGYVKSWESIRALLSSQDIEELRYLVLTHPHADHIGGTIQLLEEYPVEAALLPPITADTGIYSRVMNALEASEVELIYPMVGDQFTLGEAQITVYGPHPVAYAEPNDWSLVLMVEYAGRRILLTGDIEAEAEFDLLSFSDTFPLDADVLKVAHHGSDTSSTLGFISSVSPQYAIISCASDAEYPHVETAMNLFDCGVEDVFLTSSAGNIFVSITSNGTLTVSTSKSPDNTES